MAADELKAASRLYRAGRFDEAGTRYAQVLTVNPDNPDALAGMGEIALLRNQPQKAVRLFRDADDRGSRLTRLWPLSTQRATSEAWAHYRADDFAQAASCFKRAAGPIRMGPFSHLAALARHMASFGDERPYVIEGPRTTRVELIAVDPLPVLEVVVGERTRALFFIDSGGAETILDRQFAQALGVSTVAEMRGEGAGPSGMIGLGRIDSLRVGECVVRNVPIHTLDMSVFSDVFGALEVRGIIGTRFLMHFLATIDYVQGVLELTCKDARAKKTRAYAPGATVIPFWLFQSHYMLVPGSMNGSPYTLFLVDTGLARTGCSASPATLRAAGVVLDWSTAVQASGGFGKVKSVDFVVDELAIGSGDNRFVRRNLPGIATDPPISVMGETLGFHIGGLVSHQFFRECALTIDFAAMDIVLDAAPQRAAVGADLPAFAKATAGKQTGPIVSS